MRVLICPSPYKGSLTSSQVALAIEAGVKRSNPDAQCTLLPIADGGDGTIEALSMAAGGSLEHLRVLGPSDDSLVDAVWLRFDGWAVVELASASGLAHLSQGSLLPLKAHTYGTGMAMRRAIDYGARRIVVCVGGSASTDGGSGALKALGAKFFGPGGHELPLGGGPLLDLSRADLEGLKRWTDRCQFQVAVDVTTPLLGLTGASRMFGPQKGASPGQVDLLEQALARYADVLEQETGRRCRNIAGAGAAGGTAFGLAAALAAEIMPGFAWLAELMQIEERVKKSDIVISAEGMLDKQSVVGKATGELAKICRHLDRPLIVLPAVAQEGVDWQSYGIMKVVPTVPAPGATARAEDVSRAASLLALAQDVRQISR